MEEVCVLLKSPGKKPRRVNVNREDLGEPLKHIRLASDLAIVYHPGGQRPGRPYNTTICGVDFAGDIWLCGFNRTESGFSPADLPGTWAEIRQLLPNLWRV